MRAVSLHPDVIVVTSAVLQLNCLIVRGPAGEPQGSGGATGEGETFVIDSPLLPEELDALRALVTQAQFPAPAGLLATHADWDHLLARLAFPDLVLGCAESSAARLSAVPGGVQRELRAFDEELMIDRERPLQLGAVQPLPVPGRCGLGDQELELHPAAGHTGDGMAIAIGWAGVLAAGDYLSAVELPSLGEGGDLAAYLATLERLRTLAAAADHVVPGHGPVLDRERALSLLEEDRRYLLGLAENGVHAELPAGRRGAAQRRLHATNAAAVHAG